MLLVSNNVKNHITELQSIRGIAAMIVLIHHSLRTLNSNNITYFFSDVILNAHAAVVIFFILSGYVLGKSILERGFGIQNVATFYIHRLFRIYPALWVAVILGAMYYYFSPGYFSENESDWMRSYYVPGSIGINKAAMSFAGVSGALLPQLWTITIEIVIALFIPAIVLIQSRGKWYSVFVIMIAGAISFLIPGDFKFVSTYLVHFCLGIHLSTIKMTDMNSGVAASVIAASSLVVLIFFRQLSTWGYHHPLPGLVEGFASVVLIAAVIHGGAKWLRWRPLVRVGDWSFSIYLIHLPIAFAITKCIERFTIQNAEMWEKNLLVAILTVAFTIPISAAIYKFVEVPFIGMGRMLASKLREKSTQRAAS